MMTALKMLTPKLSRSNQFRLIYAQPQRVHSRSREEFLFLEKKQRIALIIDSIVPQLKDRRSLSVDEWKTLGTQIAKGLDHRTNAVHCHVFDALLEIQAENDWVQNMKNYIQAFELPHDFLVKRALIRVYTKKATEQHLTEEEEQEIIKLCNELVAQEMHVFPENNLLIIKGFCATKEWKKSLELGDTAFGATDIIICRAIRENEIDLVWSILDRLATKSENYQLITTKSIYAFVEHFKTYPESIPECMSKLLPLFKRFELRISTAAAEDLTTCLHAAGHHAHILNIDYPGVCGACNSSIRPVGLSTSEFETLRNEFMSQALKQADILQIRPSDLQRLEQVVQENGPFDIVMDGLNVCYGANVRNFWNGKKIQKGKRNYTETGSSKSLEKVIKQLALEGKRILMIGRIHMTKGWNFESIEKRATVFFADNESTDDIYVLYAAFCSGQQTNVLSNDFMLQHKSVVQSKFRDLFKLWQQESWQMIKITETKEFELKRKTQFHMHCQEVNDHWHLPIRTGDEELREWICIRIDLNGCAQSNSIRNGYFHANFNEYFKRLRYHISKNLRAWF